MEAEGCAHEQIMELIKEQGNLVRTLKEQGAAKDKVKEKDDLSDFSTVPFGRK